MAVNTTVAVVMPEMGESVTEGTILEWRKAEGDSISADDILVEISTDKVDAEVPSPTTGVVVKIYAAEGDTVEVGSLLAEIQVDPEAAQAPTASDGDTSVAQPAAASAQPVSDVGPSSDSVKASPVARRTATALGVDLDHVAGSGRAGRIDKADVVAAAQGGATNGLAPAGASAAGSTVIKGAAATLARYMDDSRQIPTATSFRTITVTTLDGRRKELKAAGQKVSFTHLIAYALVRAATDIPVMAHHFAEVDGKPHRFDDDAVNLGLAVDVEKKDGSRTLMVPVIGDAGRLSFTDFLGAYNALVEKARTNTLTADDLASTNITLTNPGGLGTVASVPRLMVGQGTIVATGSIAYPVGLGEIGASIGAEKVMTMTSTYDHRIIQGAESGRFLARLEELLQGQDSFYEDIFASLGVAAGPPPPKPVATGAAVALGQAAHAPTSEDLLQAVQAATSLLKAHRMHGHHAAQLDPLLTAAQGDPALDPEPLGLTPAVMAQIPARILRMYVPGETLADALPRLREVYCGPLAYELEHIASHRQRVWLREMVESGAFRKPLTSDEQRALVKRLIEVDAFERFMHKAYLGQKQFSVEGLDMSVAIIDELIKLSAGIGAQEVVIGMAHRGRLNVLAHNFGRAYETIFAEFEGVSTLEVVTSIPQGGTGDVKYHHGAQTSFARPDGGEMVLTLESNPSHLEYVAPVVMGATRAVQTDRSGPHARQDTDACVSVMVHGDAAFPGQGVVSETFNLQALKGYQVGGSVHLIQNNQVGFTTDPEDGRSTRWASDLAKGFDVPIIHVNADDVEACISAARLAFAFRQEFGHDVVIDLIGYRRYGHNEADEPAYTHPQMYQRIKDHPRVREIFAADLVSKGVVTNDEVESMDQEIWHQLADLHKQLKDQIADASDGVDERTGQYELDRSASPQVETSVDADRLIALNEELLRIPEGFNVHPKLVRQLERRREAMGAEGGIDWAQAEALAFASLLTVGTPIRLTGQDCERGTFSQRHLVLHDAETGEPYCPLQNISNALVPMELHNSSLSEIACLGFEYGYSQKASDALVLWEAQFGDFANGAQVIIDQFIVSGLAKWGQTTRLTLLLPHGYEGSGPEHSSARLERFLQLAAEGNIRVANVTTPAQYFHLLRRQALVTKQRPLVVMTPKSLLRLPAATSRIEHLADSQFFPVLAEPRVDVGKVERLVLCTGKIYYELVGHASHGAQDRVAIGRVEQLYPFPEGPLLELIDSYPNLREVVWVQEEPRNMGARAHMSPRLAQMIGDKIQLGYIGRPERASTGEGYPVAHAKEQSRIVSTALNLETAVSMYPRRTPGER